jgi:hypothetical protein
MSGFYTSTPRVMPSNKRKNLNKASNASLRIQKKPLVHRIFEDATEFTTDRYWKDTLIAAARGEFVQKSIFFDGQYLCKTKKRGVGKELIPPNDPCKACSAFIKFHREHVSVLSSTDLNNAQRDRNECTDEDTPIEWGNCGRKFRHSLLCSYVEKLSADSILSSDTCKALETDLILLANNGLLNSKNVEIHNNEICSILPLVLYPDSDSFCFTRDLETDWLKKQNAAKPKKKKKPDKNYGCIAASYNVSTSPHK